jgi:outer membrane receptor protein involved in Fe transport
MRRKVQRQLVQLMSWQKGKNRCNIYATNLYADFNPTYLTSVSDKGSLKLPSYGLVDAGFSYKVLLGQNRDDSVLFRLNVNNVLDAVYISESKRIS